MAQFRIEKDSMGELQVPADALYGAQTQRAVNNFAVSGMPLPVAFIRALGLVKAVCAEVNRDAGELDATLAAAIICAADEVAGGSHGMVVWSIAPRRWARSVRNSGGSSNSASGPY